MTNAVLSIKNLSKRFDALVAAKDISLDLYPGEIHALIGPNGAGKSTLIKMIAGSLKPDSGKIYFNDKDVTKLDTAERAMQGLARTFQVSALAMEDTVLQNALLGVVGAQASSFSLFKSAHKNVAFREPAEAALAKLGLLDKAAMRASELSHGERRKLEIAVALTLRPKAFVMDEPMAGLGAEGSKAITGFLDTLRTEAPILMVEHDMDAVFALADRVSVILYGEIIATGNVEEIRNSAQVREAYLGSEA